ncbi:MAG: NADH-quinone oxidoreductase subunit B [Ktedonobacterales bacterium]|nr:NADH-quinone oxidoreductase subunit B [Ktedonobacterales bacterium]
MSEFQAARRAAVWVLPLETGGCGASLQSIYALLAPDYAAELRTQGVSFARSPRHADVVLITGPLTVVAREPVQRLLATVPQPRALVAVGNCAIDGCVFGASSSIHNNAAELLDVHVEVAGCPPSPSAILAAIVEARQLLANAEAGVEEDDEDEEAQAEDAEVEAGVSRETTSGETTSGGEDNA